METLTGGTGSESFTVNSGVAFNGSIAGGDGTDELGATDGTNAWVISGTNEGKLNTDTE